MVDGGGARSDGSLSYRSPSHPQRFANNDNNNKSSNNIKSNRNNDFYYTISDAVEYWNEELVPLKGCDGDDNFAEEDDDDDNHNAIRNAREKDATLIISNRRRRRPNNNENDEQQKLPLSMALKERSLSVISIAASLVALALCAAWALSSTIWLGSSRGGAQHVLPPHLADSFSSSSSNQSTSETRPRPSPFSNDQQRQQAAASLYYDDMGRYILPDYDVHPPFADFLPALAGLYGKPLYAFYVNRGQAIASFGIKSKDYPIMEFTSANKAYQNTPLIGFRTFLQVSRPKPQPPLMGLGRTGSSSSSFENGGSPVTVIEPFSPLQTRYPSSSSSSSSSSDTAGATAVLPRRTLYVGSNEMQIQEINAQQGVETNVTFFILPEEDFGAFVKRTTVTNLGTTPLSVSMLDGLARMEPAGGKLDQYLKTMGRTLEGWMGVYQPYPDTIQMPFYRLSSEPGDAASVVVQTAGHWCLSVLEEKEPIDADEEASQFRGRSSLHLTEPSLLPIIYDPSKVFGPDTTYINPVQLWSKSINDIIQEAQYGTAKTPSAFAAVERMVLAPGESVTVSTFFGTANNIFDVPVISRRLLQPGFVQYKVLRSREIIKQITASVETRTAQPLLDGHVQQMFLDNVLRGGIPSILGEVDDDARMRSADEDDRLKVYHLFSRIHGDLERDYNDFQIAPTFFSQGPVNFRDVIQNRRSDVQFNPRMGSFNIRTFLSFIQADGYEPLSVEAVVFIIEDLETCKRIAARAVGEADGHRAQREALTGILNSGPFRPGQVFLLMEEQHIELIISKQDFIDELASSSDSFPMAVYKSGYWADHFTYYLDLIQSFLSIYPDWEERIMFEQSLPYFFSPAFVKPRSDKYVLSMSYDGLGVHIRQLGATDDKDSEKHIWQKKYIENKTGWYDYESNWQHDANGKIFASRPMEKLFLLATIKFATRDAFGMGIEYEGGRPGWDDANNGLVGMVGSGMPETYELVLILRYISGTVKRFSQSLRIPVELHDLILAIERALNRLPNEKLTETGKKMNTTVPAHLFDYWDAVATARETYRTKTKVTFNGTTVLMGTDRVTSLIKAWLDEIDLGIQRAHLFGTRGKGDNGKFGITPTYFSYDVTKWERTGKRNKDGHPLVAPMQMKVGIFPLFLEGPTRMMKTLEPDAAKEVYRQVRNSPLRDKALGMYTISASLEGQSVDMGREMAFAPGWLENESVWLHMSYKFYLELIRHGLFAEFYEEMTSGGMLPFMDPAVYGRSLMECSSFLASSSFEDPDVRGRGFLARLSGSTAEYLSMWLLMMTGPQLFYMDKESGEVRMQLLPALPRWLFSSEDELPVPPSATATASSAPPNDVPKLSFKLFGAIDVTYYHLRGDEDLFRIPPSRYVIGFRDGSTFAVDGPSIPSNLADKIRRVVFVASIEAYFEP